MNNVTRYLSIYSRALSFLYIIFTYSMNHLTISLLKKPNPAIFQQKIQFDFKYGAGCSKINSAEGRKPQRSIPGDSQRALEEFYKIYLWIIIIFFLPKAHFNYIFKNWLSANPNQPKRKISFIFFGKTFNLWVVERADSRTLGCNGEESQRRIDCLFLFLCWTFLSSTFISFVEKVESGTLGCNREESRGTLPTRGKAGKGGLRCNLMDFYPTK